MTSIRTTTAMNNTNMVTSGAGVTLTSGGAGNTIINPKYVGTNESKDMNDWSISEFQNFVKWFVEVHHPEVVEQYQAVRAIERKVEEENKPAVKLNHQFGWTDPTIHPTMYYPIGTSIGATVTPNKEEPKTSIWEAMKKMAGY
jgi:hypothetical protein